MISTFDIDELASYLGQWLNQVSPYIGIILSTDLLHQEEKKNKRKRRRRKKKKR